MPQETPNINSRPSFKILTKKVVRPKIKEIRSNFYSRSAKLRYAIRNDASFFCPKEFKKKFISYFNLEDIKL